MQLELSGPKLRLALEGLVARAEDEGGVEAYVEALKAKAALFRDALPALEPKSLRTLCAHMATVRRRVGGYATAERFAEMHERIGLLFAGSEDTSTADARIARFCAAFPQDR